MNDTQFTIRNSQSFSIKNTGEFLVEKFYDAADLCGMLSCVFFSEKIDT